MDLLSTLRILIRRWYVSVPVALGSVALAAYLFTSIEPSYEATGTSLLRNPSGLDQVMASENPYLGYGSLFVAGKVATDIVSSPASREALADDGAEGTFELFIDNSTMAPIISTRFQAPTETAALEGAARVLQEVQDVLEARQKEIGAPPGSWISSEVISAPTRTTQLYGSRLRAAGAVVAAGALLSVGLALLTEAVARRRARGVPDPQLQESQKSDEAPCSLCARFMPAADLIHHLETEHGLTRPSGTRPSPIARLAPASRRSGNPADSPADPSGATPSSTDEVPAPDSTAVTRLDQHTRGSRTRRRVGTRT